MKPTRYKRNITFAAVGKNNGRVFKHVEEYRILNGSFKGINVEVDWCNKFYYIIYLKVSSCFQNNGTIIASNKPQLNVVDERKEQYV